ncbi:MAG TPA: ATP-binding protein [Tepidisphaeraceae bacterium]|jgi:PAS domain S-box-containing protein/excisionase family DNA binding protein|nr:ATP-binding protein [Tepidisphaeraceae bacterium]
MVEQRTQQRLTDYLTVGEAADFLGVSPWTLRNWDKAGRLKAVRHPKNGYRIYRQQDLEAVLDPGDAFAPTGRTQSRIDWTQMGEREHFVQFYEDDAFLEDSVAGYVGTGMENDEGAVVIATRDHRVAIAKKLKARGINLNEARANGQYIALDAGETLDRFMVNGMPDAQLFMQVIGRVLRQNLEGRKRARAFGEMVAILWEQGNRAAAIRLEELWNELGRVHTFSLFCAYPMSAFSGDGQIDPLKNVCTCHTRVIPAESYASLSSPEDRLTAITLLQQKAQSLSAEIEHRKEVEKALMQRERELSDFFENAQEGIHQVGPDGVILWANKAELNMLGYGQDEYVGHHIAEFHVDCPSIDDILRKLLIGESLIDQPSRMRCKDGSIKHVLINSNAYFEEGEFIHTRCFTRDVTTRLKVEEELRQAKVAAEEANRAKDQFLAVLSHELRTPLTPVLMTTAMMESEPGLSPRSREDLATIRRNIALETQLIDDLLDLSRVINGKMSLHKRDLDVHPLVRNVVEMVGADARDKEIHIKLELKAKRDRVYGDSARLHQVIWNLLKNAIKFTPEKGRITIRTRNHPGGQLIIEVQDTGIGIEPLNLPSIFNAFEQGEQGTARRFGGLGLGLAISKTVVDMHQGSIVAKSEGKGQGACFTVELATIAPADEPVELANPAARSTKESRPLRILLVDDHLDTLRVLRRILESDGHSVTPATSVHEAIRAAEANGFDLLISDIGLPDGSGTDVVRSVRACHPEMPAIAMTGFGMEQDIRNSEEAGFTMHLTKPVDVNSLEAAIRELTNPTQH